MLLFFCNSHMENDHLEIPPSGKVYSTKMVVISSFCGGLVAGGYMMHRNFKTLGQESKANMTLVFTVFALLLVGSTSFIPTLDKIPTIYYNLCFTFITSFIMQKYQSHGLNTFTGAGGEIHSAGKAVLVCVLALAILLTVGLGIFLLQDM